MLVRWKTMEHESDGDTNCNCCTQYIHQRIGAGTGGLGNKRTSRDYPNYSIINIGKNTEENLRRLSLTLTPVETINKNWREKCSNKLNNNNNNTLKGVMIMIITRRVMMIWRELLSLRLHWKTTRYRWCEKFSKSDHSNDIILLSIFTLYNPKDYRFEATIKNCHVNSLK